MAITNLQFQKIEKQTHKMIFKHIKKMIVNWILTNGCNYFSETVLPIWLRSYLYCQLKFGSDLTYTVTWNLALILLILSVCRWIKKNIWNLNKSTYYLFTKCSKNIHQKPLDFLKLPFCDFFIYFTIVYFKKMFGLSAWDNYSRC